MKLIGIFFLIPFCLFGQKTDIKKQGDKLELVLDGTYIVSRDTIDNVITISLKPTDQVVIELEQKQNKLVTEELLIDEEIDNLQLRKRAIRQEMKEIEKLLNNLRKRK